MTHCTAYLKETMAQPNGPAEQTPRQRVLDRRAEALDESAIDLHEQDWDSRGVEREGEGDLAFADVDGDQLDREERAALRRVAGLSTELEDVTEVEYRQLRLERVVLASVWEDNGQDTLEDAENSLRELAALAETAGSTVLDGLIQRRLKPDPATYLGSGKAAELAEIVAEVGADTVIADSELSPSQRRALEDIVKVKVVDRTAVILDIFAQHAKSREGKAQVELAQLRYRLPRLRRRAGALSQQAGGMSAAGGARIGTRGPGETQLEVDRRRIVRRIHKLESDLREITQHRATQRKAQRRGQLAKVVIVGYTNAGKSTLLNRLTDAGVLVEDRLFATLDATTRRLSLPGGEAVLVTDTVGFIRKLPHQLVQAFTSTLDVAVDADLLVHVVDASAPDVAGNMQAVREVLAEIGAGDVPELVAFNKSDLAPDEAERLREGREGSVALSAVTGEGVDRLLATIGDRLRSLTTLVDMVIPFDRGDLLAAAHREGEVLVEEPGEGGMHVRGRFDDAAVGRFSEFVVQ